MGSPLGVPLSFLLYSILLPMIQRLNLTLLLCPTVRSKFRRTPRFSLRRGSRSNTRKSSARVIEAAALVVPEWPALPPRQELVVRRPGPAIPRRLSSNAGSTTERDTGRCSSTISSAPSIRSTKCVRGTRAKANVKRSSCAWKDIPKIFTRSWNIGR